MKLLMENWKNFLRESEESFFPWLEDLKADPYGYLFDRTKVDYMGGGSYRTAHKPKGEKDFVIKIMKSNLDPYSDEGSWMNKVEKFLGDTYPDVFPKVYAAADDFLWIVVERVTPISNKNKELLEEAFMATMPGLYEFVYDKFEEETKLKPENFPFELLRIIVKAAAHGGERDYRSSNPLIKAAFEYGLENEPWFNDLTKAITRYGVESEDIREGNIGISKDHTLKVLDASVFFQDDGELKWSNL